MQYTNRVRFIVATIGFFIGLYVIPTVLFGSPINALPIAIFLSIFAAALYTPVRSFFEGQRGHSHTRNR